MRHLSLWKLTLACGITAFLSEGVLDSSVFAQGGGGPARVEVTPLVTREVATGQTFVGTIIPTRRAVIGSAVDGRVIEFPVEEGYRVDANQTLVQLLTHTIGLEVEAARAELKLRRDELAELENGTRPSEIEQTRARMERARVSMEYLSNELKRLERLHKQNATTESGLDRAMSASLEAKQQFDDAKAAHQLAVDGPRIEQIEQAKAQVAIQDALVRKLEDQMKKYTIFSRFPGYVTAKHTEVGAWVSQGDPVAEVIELDEVDIVAKVVEEHIPFIHLRDSVRVEVPALPDETFTGFVGTIIPQADLRSRTFPVSIRVKNTILKSGQPLLKAGMLARVTLATGERKMATLVPKDAIVLGGREPMIWLISNDAVTTNQQSLQQGGAVAVPVRLGVADGNLIQVEGSIQPESLVVTRGNERIPPNPTGAPSPVVWAKSSNDK